MSAYVLVHGAWHGAWCWENIVPLLVSEGHRVVAPDLPGAGKDLTPPRAVTLQGYADRVCQTLAMLDEPAILVGHSMGGAVITQAAEQCPERIRLLVYVAAFLLQDGESVFQVGTSDPGSLLTPSLIPDESEGVLRLKEGAGLAAFYHDCPEPEAQRAASRLRPNPLAPLATPTSTTQGRFGRVPRVYVETLQDRAISLPAQRKMYAARPCEQIFTLDTSHSPFYSAPRELATILLRLASDAPAAAR